MRGVTGTQAGAFGALARRWHATQALPHHSPLAARRPSRGGGGARAARRAGRRAHVSQDGLHAAEGAAHEAARVGALVVLRDLGAARRVVRGWHGHRKRDLDLVGAVAGRLGDRLGQAARPRVGITDDGRVDWEAVGLHGVGHAREAGEGVAGAAAGGGWACAEGGARGGVRGCGGGGGGDGARAALALRGGGGGGWVRRPARRACWMRRSAQALETPAAWLTGARSEGARRRDARAVAHLYVSSPARADAASSPRTAASRSDRPRGLAIATTVSTARWVCLRDLVAGQTQIFPVGACPPKDSDENSTDRLITTRLCGRPSHVCAREFARLRTHGRCESEIYCKEE